MHKKCEDAAQAAVTVAWRYAQSGKSLASVALAGAAQCRQGQHYPARDVVDDVHGYRFYYHAHPSSRYPAQEHGHFHLFSNGAGRLGFAHLGGLSLDNMGQPLRWFMTNGWVTGETLQAASHARVALKGFQVQTCGRLAPLARWVSAMAVLYAQELDELLLARDQWLVQRTAALGAAAQTVWDDRQVDVVCERSIDWTGKLAQFV